MRKLIQALILSLCMVLLSVTLVSAQPTDLARYFPEDTALYVAFRTDETTLDAINSLVTRVGGKVGMPFPAMSETWLRDAVAGQINGYRNPDFDVLDWVGAEIVFAQVNFDSQTNQVAVIAVKDRDAAEVYLAEAVKADIERGYLEAVDVEGATYYRMTEGTDYWESNSYLLTDDALLITDNAALLDTLPEKSLAENESFTAALDALPADDYGAIVFMQQRVFVDEVAQEARKDPNAPDIQWEKLREAFGGFAAGVTMVDEHTLVMDFAQTPGTISIPEALGLPAPTVVEYAALDPAFAANVPVSTVLYMQGSQFGDWFTALWQDIPAIADPLIATYVVPMVDDPQDAAILREFTLKRVRTFIDLTFKGALGQPVGELMSVLNGQNAAFVTLSNTALENGMLFETTGDASIILDGLKRLLDDFEFAYTEAENGLSLPFGSALPFDASQIGVGETVFRADEEFVFIGSPSWVTFSGREGALSLADSPAYQAAQSTFLPDAEVIWFINPAPLREALQNPEFLQALPPDVQNVQMLLNLMDAASMSQATQENGTVLTRWSIGLTR